MDIVIISVSVVLALVMFASIYIEVVNKMFKGEI